jgi:hypothetical protein
MTRRDRSSFFEEGDWPTPKLAEKLQLISEAIINGFDVGSPLSAMIEASVDLNLLIAELIRHGIKLKHDAKIVKILESANDPLIYEVTELMNVKSLVFKADNPIINNPDLADFFDHIAEINIQILRNPKTNPYMGLGNKDQKSLKIKHSQYEYYKRRRRNVKSSHK